MNPKFKDYLLEVTSSTDCVESEVIQSLWSGYGTISRYRLSSAQLDTVVVKHISLHRAGEHPRGWNSDFGHQRKVKSYQVESNWYKDWGPQCPAACRIPQFIGHFEAEDEHWIIMEDLHERFPVRKSRINLQEVKVCIQWLAHFHAYFLGRRPENLWTIGTYWHLGTRPDELKQLQHAELKTQAHRIDEALNACRFQTIVHGDAKLANFCFSNEGNSVAVVDFQYVGGGCGMKDLAYFMSSCLSAEDCEILEEKLLDCYFSNLKRALDAYEKKVVFDELEWEWRSLYPMAYTDFMRFLLGWMPSHQKINEYSLKLMNKVLSG